MSEEGRGSEAESGRTTTISTDSGEPEEYFIDIDPRRSIRRSSCYTSSISSCDTPSTATTSSVCTPAGGGCGSKPHKAKDAGWEAIRSLKSARRLGLSHFRIMHRLGRGDIGSVYLAELKGSGCYFAVKVMDKKGLSSRNKVLRAETEWSILQMLDHPFLPTLYAHLDTLQFSCLVIDFCPGGDLHVLRQRHPGRRFGDHAARFYASEVLLALEYLHMMGIIYRDLKPENVLVRDDGHIMLTDFDLSLKSSVCPSLLGTPPVAVPRSPLPATVASSSCILPACVMPCTAGGRQPQHHHQQQQAMVSCLPIFSRRKKVKSKSNKLFRHHEHPPVALPELLVEPTEARSMSFVGTHEYLAPEIVAGDGHGNAVDWWTFGVFIFELLYGQTPFRGSDNEATLNNVVSQPLRFPDEGNEEGESCKGGIIIPRPSAAAKDLIRGLLVKDPAKRLGSTKGATEIKQQAFFRGVNWPLIRCSIPPHIPSPFNAPLRPPPLSPPEEKNYTSSDFEYF